MKIGIDGTGIFGLNERAPGGVINYTLCIIDSLLKIDKDNQYLIYCRNNIPDQLAEYSSKVSFRILRSNNRKIVQMFHLPLAAKKDGIDLMFFPFNSTSLFCPFKSVVTIHDMHPFVVPRAFETVHSSGVHGGNFRSRINQFYWEWMLKMASRKERIIVPSMATKNDIIRIFGTAEEKIEVTYEGVDLARFNTSEGSYNEITFREKHGLPENYLLCVGAHGYKNIPGAIRAFSIAKKDYAHTLNLVIAGNKRHIGQEIYQLVKELEIEENVIFPGFFPDEDLKYLYRFAKLLLFPSHYEGFGLPVLESLACGTPVVTSTTGSLPEVGGKAVLLADPNNFEDIASAILTLLTDEKLRNEKIAEGIQHVKKFSWESAAEKTLAVFKDTYPG